PALDRELQLHAAPAHPSLLPARVAGDQRKIRNIAGYDGARSHKGKTPDRESTENGCVRSQGDPLPDKRWAVLMLPGDVAAGVDHIREHDRRPAEHAVFQRHAVVDRNVVLDFDASAHDGAGGDKDVLADGTPRAKRGPFRDM